MAKITVILPVYNEAASIAGTLREFHLKLIGPVEGAELMVVEDGSTDGTKEILHDLRQHIPFTLISGDIRKGYTRAFKEALRIPMTPLIFFSDSDRQHDPGDFLKLLPWTDRFDIVSGCKSPRQDPFYRLLLSRAYHVVLGVLFGVWFRDINSGFKIIKKEVIDAVLPDVKDLQQCVMSEFVLKAYLHGFKIKEIPVRHFPRKSGNSMFTAKNTVPIALQILGGLWTIRQSRRGVHKSSIAT